MWREGLVEPGLRLDACRPRHDRRGEDLGQLRLRLPHGHALDIRDEGIEDDVRGGDLWPGEIVAAQLARKVRELLGEPLAALRHALRIRRRVALEEELLDDGVQSLAPEIR